MHRRMVEFPPSGLSFKTAFISFYYSGYKSAKAVALPSQFQGGRRFLCFFALSWDVKGKVKHSYFDFPTPSNCPDDRFFVLDPLQSHVLQWGHSSRLAYPHGMQCNLALLHHLFWWSSMVEDTQEFVVACPLL